MSLAPNKAGVFAATRARPGAWACRFDGGTAVRARRNSADAKQIVQRWLRQRRQRGVDLLQVFLELDGVCMHDASARLAAGRKAAIDKRGYIVGESPAPPMPGWSWQARHDEALKTGPSPSPP